MLRKNCSYDSDYSNGCLSVVLHGEIDHHSAVSLRSGLDAKIYEIRPGKMTLDLSQIDFMDSSGLGLIMGRYALMQKLGGDFSVVNPNERVQKILGLSGLGRIVKIEEETKEKE